MLISRLKMMMMIMMMMMMMMTIFSGRLYVGKYTGVS